MHQLIFTAIAFSAIIAFVHGQDMNDKIDTTKPGPEHTRLMAFVGTWELTVEGVEKKGSAEIKSILGGRFITEDIKLPFGDFDMAWHGVIGYDRVKKQYTGVWFDNMNNTTQSRSGDVDSSGRIISFRGEHAGNAQFLWRISNDGERTMTIEMFQVADDGKEMRVMKVIGEKKK